MDHHKHTTQQRNLPRVEDYEQFVGTATVQRILDKSQMLQGLHVVHVNSTYYGGGVAELLSSLSLLMNTAGITTGWRVLQGSPDFFSITKKMHNALQGADINLSRRKREIYEQIVYENAIRNHFEDDLVIVHDPQPLPLITHYKERGSWLWRGHIDLSRPSSSIWNYLSSFIEKYDTAILSLPEYRQELSVPQEFFMPAIDPFSIKNRELSDEEIDERLGYYNIPSDLPLVVQISRFDRWKDPEGVIRAYKMARRDVDCTLVLLGNVATDDPEGAVLYESLLTNREDRVIILSHQDSALVNALQRRAAVIVQKSIREGFGLTVTEAMWKGTPVIGGNVGGICHQIEDGVNGFLVSAVDDTAEQIVKLIRDSDLRRRMGANARESVRRRFLMTRLLEQYLDLFISLKSKNRSYPRLEDTYGMVD